MKEKMIKSLAFNFEVKAASDADKVLIEGLASTTSIDLDNDIVLASAFSESIGEYLKNGKLLWMHDWYGIPFGKVTSASIEPNGIRVTAEVWSDNDEGKRLARAIKEGVVNAFSIGFRILESTQDNTKKPSVRTITKARLLEISVVQLGANPEALFAMQQKMNDRYKETETIDPMEGKEKKGMSNVSDQTTLEAIKEFEKKFKDSEPALEQAKALVAEHETLKSKVVKLDNLLTELGKRMSGDLMTKADAQSYVDRMTTDYKAAVEGLQSANAARKAIEYSARFGGDIRFNIPGYVFLKDDNGNPLPERDQKAFLLMQMPVDYAKAKDGELLKLIHDLNDTVVLMDAYNRGRGTRTDVRASKTYKALKSLVQMYTGENDVYKALYSTGAGVGDEWVPTNMSNQMHDLIRIRRGLFTMFPQFDMTSNPQDWPIKTSGVTYYRAPESATDNPSVLTGSNVGTGKVTFDAETIAGLVNVSAELPEDSAILIIPVVREELAFGAVDSIEDMTINGDDSASHFDTGRSLTSASSSILCVTKGLRKYAVLGSNTFDAQSTSAGVGNAAATLGLADFGYMIRQLAEAGANPADVVMIVNLATRIAYGVLVADQAASGIAFTQRGTSSLEAILGCELYVSPKITTDYASTGLYTGTGALSVALAANKTQFRYGVKRQITVEFDKDIRTQQWAFVGTMRVDFQKMSASALKPVCQMNNIAA